MLFRKAAMFEQAAKDAGPHDVVKKKTWASSGNSGGHSNMGKFKGKTQIGDGPPAKRGMERRGFLSIASDLLTRTFLSSTYTMYCRVGRPSLKTMCSLR